MLMDNTLELLGITDSNIKITRFSAESVNGEKRNVIEARLAYNVDRCPYCESENAGQSQSQPDRLRSAFCLTQARNGTFFPAAF